MHRISKECIIWFDSLAQQVEHNTFNVGVLGSSPKRITERRNRSNYFSFKPYSNHPPKVTPLHLSYFFKKISLSFKKNILNLHRYCILAPCKSSANHSILDKMRVEFFNYQAFSRWIALIILAISPWLPVWAQSGGENTAEELIRLGFENVRWTENDTERIYTIENNVYKANGVGIAKAIETIQKTGLPIGKQCKVIVTNFEIPEIALTYQPSNCDSISDSRMSNWQTSYELGNSWKEVKKEKIKNSSRFKVDIVVYPQLSYKNYIITQIYQALFTLNPAIEVSLWQGMKLTGQVIIPIYNDGYGTLQDKIHPGFLTISQRFRLPNNIQAKVTLGYFSNERYGADLRLFRPFKFDERFSLEGRLGYTGIGRWDAFHLKYDKDMVWTWTIGGNFYWPQYNTEFKLKAEQYLLGEKGVKFEMIRHFRYTSIGFYAMKAEHANSNGGFRFQVLLPPYKYKHFKGKYKYIPRVSTSSQMGIVYNAGNERVYYKNYRSEANENIMNDNSFNPYFIKSELSNY